jgi:hypothetical protein
LEDAMNLPLPSRTAAAAALAAAAITSAACTVLQPPGHAPAHPHPAASSAQDPAGPASPGLGALLPIRAAQLRAAAALAARFAAAYDTTGPGQRPSAWLARLAPMATRQLAGALARTAATPALWQHPQPQAGQAVAVQIRDLTPGSVTFTVQVRQAIPAPTSHRTATQGFAVTVISRGDGWAVYDIEPAAAGNTR